MQIKKLNKVLFIIAVISSIFFVLSFFFSKTKASAPKVTKTAFLNPKYEEAVTSITIGTKNAWLVLDKNNKINGFWFAHNEFFDESGNLISVSKTTLADSKLVKTLLSNSSKIRNIRKISDKKSDFEKLELSPSNSTWIVFSDAEKSLSKIFFGISDSLSKTRTFCTNPPKNRIFPKENSVSAYETEDNLSQFLTTDIDYWADGEIFSEIESPETIKFSYPEKNIDFSMNSSSPDFASISHSILSLRHGKVQDFSKSEKIAELRVYDGSSKITTIEFFKADSVYFLKKTHISEYYEPFYDSFEISEWTFNRIVENFIKK